jgi:hypothetical protein
MMPDWPWADSGTSSATLTWLRLSGVPWGEVAAPGGGDAVAISGGEPFVAHAPASTHTAIPSGPQIARNAVAPVLVRAMFPQAANYRRKYPADGDRARRNPTQ